MITRTSIWFALGILTSTAYGCRNHAALSTDAASCAQLTITGFASPESIASSGERLFVSNIGPALEPLARDGDGFITEMDDTGRIVERRAFPTGNERLNAPKGLAVAGGLLYVADIDRVVGFDIHTRAQVYEARLQDGQPTLLNDLAVESSTSLLVSDTIRGVLYRLDLPHQIFYTLVAGIPGANGIVIDAAADIAYVAGIGERFSGGDLFAVPLHEPAVAHRIVGPHGLFDGIVLLPDSELVVSDWISVTQPVAGDVIAFTRSGKRLRSLAAGCTFHGPADILYRQHHLWIPVTRDNAVGVMSLRH